MDQQLTYLDWTTYATSLQTEYEQIKQVFCSYLRNLEKNRYQCFVIDEYTHYWTKMTSKKQELCEIYDRKGYKFSPKQTLKDERMHNYWQISMLIRSLFRDSFGDLSSDRCGYFLDQGMSRIIHDYSYSLDYIPGDTKLKSERRPPLKAIALSSDGQYLFAGGESKQTLIWDLTSYKVIAKLNSHAKGVHCLDYRLGRLVSGSEDSTILVWDTYSLTLKRKLRDHKRCVTSVSFNIDGDQIISSSADKTIRIWSVETGERLRYFTWHTSEVVSAYFLGDIVVSGSVDGCIKVWNPLSKRKWSEIKAISDGYGESVADLCVNCDASLVACVVSDTSMNVFCLPYLRLFRSIPLRCFHARFHPYLAHLIVVSERYKNCVSLYDVSNGECIIRMKGHKKPVNDVCFTPDGNRVISASSDGSFAMWDVSAEIALERLTKYV